MWRPCATAPLAHSYILATADTTHSLDASKLAEELRNQPSTAVTEKICKDLQHPVHESQTLRVPELHIAYGVTESQNKRVPTVLTFEGTELSPSVFLRQRTGDPSLHYKFTFSANHLMQVHETKVAKNKDEDPLAIDYRIRSLGNVKLDQVMRDQQNDDAEITFMGATSFDQDMEEAHSDMEFMPDDEILSISRDGNEEDDFDRELSMVNEVAADNILDEIITEVNKEDTHTNVSAATPITVSSVSIPQSASISSPGDVHVFEVVDVPKKCVGKHPK
ncbi:hypothetical protein Tco_1552421 [Tanacetum coccineum]